MAASPSESSTDNTAKPDTLNTDVKLTVGQLFYTDGDNKIQSCPFQFNPTELERSRTVKFTRTPTGNTLEEPRAGDRNQAKRKSTRKPEPWDMTLSLKFDASHPMFNDPPPKPPARSADEQAKPAPDVVDSTTAPEPQTTQISTTHTTTAGDGTSRTKFRYEITRIRDTMKFFEALAEVQPSEVENNKVANADETPPPPFLTLAFGRRSWKCAVKSVRIKEENYTYDLFPRRFEVSLSLEIIETVRQAEQGTGGEE